MTGDKLLGRYDEPQGSGAVVAVHWGDYRQQEIWVRSGANDCWYALGGEFGRPPVDIDERNPMQKLLDPSSFRPRPGWILQHPRWEDVLERGPVVLLVPGAAETYKAGWRNGRKDLWAGLENAVYDDPEEIPE